MRAYRHHRLIVAQALALSLGADAERLHGGLFRLPVSGLSGTAVRGLRRDADGKSLGDHPADPTWPRRLRLRRRDALSPDGLNNGATATMLLRCATMLLRCLQHRLPGARLRQCIDSDLLEERSRERTRGRWVRSSPRASRLAESHAPRLAPSRCLDWHQRGDCDGPEIGPESAGRIPPLRTLRSRKIAAWRLTSRSTSDRSRGIRSSISDAGRATSSNTCPTSSTSASTSARSISRPPGPATGKGDFRLHGAKDFVVDHAGAYDIVTANGVVHHLDDEEAATLFRLGHEVLRPGGRLVTSDGCFVAGQSPVARLLLSMDRGRYVRQADEYIRLARTAFEGVQASIRHDLLRFPFTHIMLECAAGALPPSGVSQGASHSAA